MIQDKAQSAVNGMSFTRAVTPYWIIRVASLRASREAVVRGVAPLGKDAPTQYRTACYTNGNGENRDPARRA